MKKIARKMCGTAKLAKIGASETVLGSESRWFFYFVLLLTQREHVRHVLGPICSLNV